MKSKGIKLLLTVVIGIYMISGQVFTANAENWRTTKISDHSTNETKKKNTDTQESKDQKKKEKANRIIQDMQDKGARESEIKTQQKANKQYLGHEGEGY
jgi:hypothetical protein